MGILQLNNIKKIYPPFEILQGVSGEVFLGNRIGLVGNNGTGKTTLFKIIMNLIEPDEGEVIRQRGSRIAYLSQTSELDNNLTVLEAALKGYQNLQDIEKKLAEIQEKFNHAEENEVAKLLKQQEKLQLEYEHYGGYRYRNQTEMVLNGLGFDSSFFNQKIHQLSGGQKNRLSLVITLLQDNDLLLLDEPTNFLDIQGIEWLEEYLQNSRSAMIIVSHDRYFLNKVANYIWELSFGKLTSYPGNYDKFCILKEQEFTRQQELYERQQEEIKRQEDFVRRNVYGERHKSAQSRRRMLERLERLEAPKYEKDMKIAITTDDRRTNTILETRRLGHCYGDRFLFHNLSITIGAGEKVAIVGPNGCGKSTFLHIIARGLTPAEGQVIIGNKVNVGFYHQELQDLNCEITVFDTIKELLPTSDDVVVRTYLGSFLFQGDDIYKKVGKLSGGEKSRLAMARLIIQKPNFLVLDEPTNHLDIRARQALEEALQDFEGTVLFVSHDRYFIDEIASRILYYYDHRWINFYGNYTSFQQSKSELIPKDPKNDEKKREAKEINYPIRQKKKKKYTLEELENKIIQNETRIQEIQNEWQQTSTYQNPEKVKALKEEYELLTQQLQELNQEWAAWGS